VTSEIAAPLPTDDRFLKALCDMALAAGAAIMDVRRGGAEAEVKKDGSPVTVADRRAEAIILAGLKRLAPQTPVVAEEEAAAGRVPSTDGEFFLVDPLDGTKEFLRTTDNRGEFTVNIGLIRDGAPVAGVVFAPALGKLWLARPDQAWAATVDDRGPGLFSLGALEPIRVRRVPAGGVTAIASRSHSTPETDAYLDLYPVADRRSVGSSLKFCVVAEGEADLYPRLGRTMEWDTAAGDAVLRAAGGLTVTLDGEPLRYGKRNLANEADFANPHFVALGDVAFRRP
jgi:3'(2'),5'-bisphosphate nucleotidase